MKGSSQHTFAQVPSVDIPRSSFRRNMTYKTTFDAGYLIPFYVDEIIPGDTFNFKLTSFARILSPLRFPIMDNLYMDFQFFFVPTRLVFDDYEKFFGSSKGQSGNWEYDDSHVMPGITFSSGVSVGTIGDYLGLPTGVNGIKVNALPFRAYNKIVNDWYLPSVYELTGPAINTGSSDDSPSDYALVKRIKRSDYFTSALIAPQRGPGASIGLAGAAAVYGDGMGLALSDNSIVGVLGYAQSGTGFVNDSIISRYMTGSARYVDTAGVATGTTVSMGAGQGNVRPDVSYGSVIGVATKDELDGIQYGTKTSGLYADLESASAVSINSLRQAFQLQRALERDMRGGVQYVSQLMAHFGVRSPDARLQRTEYLGGGSVPINIHSVANTTGLIGGNAQGTLAAFGTSSSNHIGWIKSFTEHGYVMGLVSVRADLTYQQGLERMWDRWTRFDYYYPVFSHLGEQTVLNKEIYCQAPTVVDSDGNVVNDLPFGYQERYAEYRYGVNKITGQLRSTYAQTLDAWHLAQKFNNLPTLSSQFLEENVPMSRVKADTAAPDILFDALLNVNCVRPMPLFGVPGLVDHF